MHKISTLTHIYAHVRLTIDIIILYWTLFFFLLRSRHKIKRSTRTVFTIIILLLTIALEKIQNKILKHIIFALRLNGQAVNS